MYISRDAYYWREQLPKIETNIFKNWYSLTSVLFPTALGKKLSFEEKSALKNFFLNEFRCWTIEKFYVRWTNKLYLVETLALYWNLYLENSSFHSKNFKAHAILQDAAWAVRWHTVNGLGSCNMDERGSNSCLLGQVTGLPVCLEEKLLLPSIFKLFS